MRIKFGVELKISVWESMLCERMSDDFSFRLLGLARLYTLGGSEFNLLYRGYYLKRRTRTHLDGLSLEVEELVHDMTERSEFEK